MVCDDGVIREQGILENLFTHALPRAEFLDAVL
jgi:hypothetical protein